MEENKEKKWTVYAHTSPEEPPRYYIGITSRPVEERWNEGRGYKGQKRFYEAIQKFGWDNFDHDIISHDLSFEDAVELESWLIKQLRCNEPDKGFNISPGGGVSRNVVGKSYQRKTDRRMSEASKEKMREARRKNPTACIHPKAVLQFDLDGNYIKEFNSVSEAGASIGLSNVSDISRCCKGSLASAYGYAWAFKKDFPNPEDYKDYFVSNLKHHADKKFRFTSIPVCKCDADFNVICIYLSMRALYRYEGIPRQMVTRACNTKTEWRGYYWKFSERSALDLYNNGSNVPIIM